jgi:hypothetical protein
MSNSSASRIRLTALFVLLCLVVAPHWAAAAGEGLPVWQISALDSAGDVGYFTSTAVDTQDAVHISYIDNTAHTLKYATNAGGAWQVTTVRNASGLRNTSIDVDSTGKVYIAFFDSSWPMLAVRDLAGAWSWASLPFHYAAANGISLGIDGKDVVHVAAPTVRKMQYGPDDYKLEYMNNSSGAFKVAKYLPTCMTGAITLRSPSLATDAGNNVHVAFNVSDALVHATNKSGDWVCRYVALSGAQPVYYSNRYLAVTSSGLSVVAVIGGTEFMALALDGADKAHIVGHQNNCLRYYTDAYGGQQSMDVDCQSAKVGEYGSVAGDSQGAVHIAYYDRTNGDLKYATTGANGPTLRRTYIPLTERN